MFAVITEKSIRMAKEGSKDMGPYYNIQWLQRENERLQQKNAKLNTLLQILNTPVVRQVSLQTRNIPVQQMPLQPNAAVLLSTPNAALSNQIEMLQRENTRLKQENNDLVSKVRTPVETVLQYE